MDPFTAYVMPISEGHPGHGLPDWEGGADPGYGQGHPMPPHVGGGPEVPLPHPGQPLPGLPPEVPPPVFINLLPSDPRPGIWPPPGPTSPPGVKPPIVMPPVGIWPPPKPAPNYIFVWVPRYGFAYVKLDVGVGGQPPTAAPKA